MRSWKLKNYFDDQKPPHPLDLVDPSASQQLGWPFSLMLSDPQLEAQANSALYQVTPDYRRIIERSRAAESHFTGATATSTLPRN